MAAASTRTCPAISPAVRFRTRPIFPVRQKPHAIAHPTCVEMQNVIDGVSGMNTDSIRRPSASSQHELAGAVDGRSSLHDARRGDDELGPAAAAAASARGRSSRSKSVTPRR